jgi:hypothetical protein
MPVPPTNYPREKNKREPGEICSQQSKRRTRGAHVDQNVRTDNKKTLTGKQEAREGQKQA